MKDYVIVTLFLVSVFYITQVIAVFFALSENEFKNRRNFFLNFIPCYWIVYIIRGLKNAINNLKNLK